MATSHDHRIVRVGPGQAAWAKSLRAAARIAYGYASLRRPTQGSEKTTCMASARLSDGTLIEMIEHPENANRTAFVVARGKERFLADRVRIGEEVLVPFPRQHELVRGLSLACGLEDYGSIEDSLSRVGGFLKARYPLSGDYQMFLGAYVVHTHVADTLPFSPVLILLAPVHISRPLVEALAEVCRNAIIMGSAQLGGIAKVCSELGATLLFIDYGVGPDLHKCLAMGARRGIVWLPSRRPLSVYGPKLLATLRIPDCSELVSDSIVVDLPFANLQGPSNNPAWTSQALRNQLLKLRLNICGTTDHGISNLPQAHLPYPGKLLQSLLAPFAPVPGLAEKIVQSASACIEHIPARIPLPHKAVVSGAFFYAHEWVGSLIVATRRLLDGPKSPLAGHAPTWVEEPGLDILTQLARGALRGLGNDAALTESEVGRILTDLHLEGFTPKTSAYRLPLTDSNLQLIHSYARGFRLLEVDVEPWGVLERLYCPLCREMGLVSEKGMRYFEESLAPRIREAERKRAEEAERRRQILDQSVIELRRKYKLE